MSYTKHPRTGDWLPSGATHRELWRGRSLEVSMPPLVSLLACGWRKAVTSRTLQAVTCEPPIYIPFIGSQSGSPVDHRDGTQGSLRSSNSRVHPPTREKRGHGDWSNSSIAKSRFPLSQAFSRSKEPSRLVGLVSRVSRCPQARFD